MGISLREFLMSTGLDLIDKKTVEEVRSNTRSHVHCVLTLWWRISAENRLNIINTYNLCMGHSEIKSSGNVRLYSGDYKKHQQDAARAANINTKISAWSSNNVENYRRNIYGSRRIYNMTLNSMFKNYNSPLFKHMKLLTINRGDFNSYPHFRDYNAVILYIINMGQDYYESVISDGTVVKKILDEYRFPPSYVH
jgi:hypothetical protein